MSIVGFLAVAIALTLVAVAVVVLPMVRERSSAVAAVASALAIPAAALLLYAAASNFPWGSDEAMAVESREAAGDSAEIMALRQAVAATPGMAEPWVKLGDGLLAEERFAEAAEAFRHALALRDDDDTLRLALAEAIILADRTSIPEEASQLLDDILQREPGDPKALWYGAMAAFARGEATTARERWSRLLELSPPPEVRTIIERQLAALAERAPTDAPAVIPVHIRIDPSLAGRVPAGAVLFLIARNPGGAGPPLAVVRRDAPTLPLDIDITDRDRMGPGGRLDGHKALRVTARLDRDGNAAATTGDVFGEATWQPAAGRLEILIDQVTP